MVYCPLAKALGIETSVSILDIPEPEWTDEMSKAARSEISRRLQRDRLNEGTHHFLDTDKQSLLGKRGYRKAVENGTHHSQQPSFKEIASKRIENGTHNFLDSETQKLNVRKGIQNGTHSSCREHTCPHCGKTGKGGGMSRWHFDNCKARP